MHFRVSREADDFLESFARGNDISKAEALSRAIALLALARDQREKGRFLGIVEEDDKRELHAVGRVSGVFHSHRHE